MSISPSDYIVLGAILFSIGLFGVLIRRNVLVILMCIELMLNAANLTFVTYSRALHDVAGDTDIFFVLVIAAAEVVIGLAIVITIFRKRLNASVDDESELKG